MRLAGPDCFRIDKLVLAIIVPGMLDTPHAAPHVEVDAPAPKF